MRTPSCLSACVVNVGVSHHEGGGVALTPPAISIPVSKGVTSRSSKSCACEDPSPERMTTMMNSASRNRSRGAKTALVGLLHIFREAELFATPEPTSTTLERAHVLLRRWRKGPHRPTLPHDPRKCARAQDKPTKSDAAPGNSAQNSRGNKSNVPPHGALGGFALTATTLVTSTPTSTSGVGRLGDGGRGATKRRGEAVCVKESVPFVFGVGRRLRDTRGLGGRGRGCRGPRGVDRWLRAD